MYGLNTAEFEVTKKSHEYQLWVSFSFDTFGQKLQEVRNIENSVNLIETNFHTISGCPF